MSVDACIQQPLTPEPSEETLVTPSVPITAPTEPPSLVGDTSCEGYTLFSSGQRTVLVDMNGELVHEWPMDGSPVKMLPGGSLLGRKGIRNDEATSPNQRSNFGGKGVPDAIELIQVGWDGQEEWSFSNWDDDGTGTMMSRQHHDHQREGNPVGYYAPGQEFVEKGKTWILARKNRVIPEISDKEIEDDVIYEVDWIGSLTGFEWSAAYHFDEMGFDDSAKEAIYSGLTFDEAKGSMDLFHINSMSLLGENHWYDGTNDERFNPENIIISSRNANFIAIISRMTGDIVWRVGPDFSEGTDDCNLGQFVGQHNAHMIPRGLPGEGNILVFDNGGRSGYGGPNGYPRYTKSYSRVVEFNPVTLEIVWQYGSEGGEESFFSRNISSAQRLPNGNTLITDGANGRIFEVTLDKESVWEFIAPSVGKKGNAIYRAYRIPPEWVPGNPSRYQEWSILFSTDNTNRLPSSDIISAPALSFAIVDTGQDECYDNKAESPCPKLSEPFYGQDAQYKGNTPRYTDNGDNTITDHVTGLTWQKTIKQVSWTDAASDALRDRTGGYADWRVPTIKELYSLINFNGFTGTAAPETDTVPEDAIPYIDTKYFDFQYPTTGRYIDAQYITNTSYVSTVTGNTEGFFGVNFADGRIKCYPKFGNLSRRTFYARYVRGNPDYGTNDFLDNEDGTVTDSATGLMWMRVDSGTFNVGDDGRGELNWEHALAWAENLEYAGYSDWRLPDAKELQSIVDYTRSPDTTSSAAINPIFSTTSIIDEGGGMNYPFYWTSTTHLDGRYPGTAAVNITFGEALGYMQVPPNSGTYQLLDVHGAGAQRSDPKVGNPADYPHGFGPQGDVRRIYNLVRCVRDAT
ncbi:DUF1566 domain-containing protein [Chloroflexota bacterium]